MEPLESFAHEWTAMKERVARLERELADRLAAAVCEHEDRPMTVKSFAQRYPDWTEGKLRKRLFHRRSNGLLKCGAVVESDGLYIVPEAFFGWLRRQKKPR